MNRAEVQGDGEIWRLGDKTIPSISQLLPSYLFRPVRSLAKSPLLSFFSSRRYVELNQLNLKVKIFTGQGMVGVKSYDFVLDLDNKGRNFLSFRMSEH